MTRRRRRRLEVVRFTPPAERAPPDQGPDPGEKKDLLDDKDVSDKYVERYKAFRRDLKEVVVKPIPK